MIYLDNNSTTQCAPEVVAAMLPFWSADFGNASSTHAMGRRAKAAIDSARESVANLLDCAPKELVFTSGATESNNLVLSGIVHSEYRRRIVTSSIEHKSVLEPCASLEGNRCEIARLPVDNQGRVSLSAAAESINDRTLLVSIQAANNETGTTQPIQQLAEIAHQRGALFHCDATQALGKIPFSLKSAEVDFASFSGHKAYGPKGVGVLFIREGLNKSRLKPIIRGGQQEMGWRPGTLNVPAIVGFGAAAQVLISRSAKDECEVRRLHDLFEKAIKDSGIQASFNGSRENRLPGTISLTIPGVQSDMLIANIPEICFSNGSACTAGAMSPSHVLLAMGMPREDAECTVRFGIGRYNTECEIIRAVAELTGTVNRLRSEMI